MTLKEKVHFICNKYNNGVLTNYAENMIDAIEKAADGEKGYTMSNDAVVYSNNVGKISFPQILIWELCYVIGECILNSDKNFFENEK